MKKIGILLAVVFLVGCGGSETKTKEVKFQGVEEGKNLVAQGMEYLKNNDIKNAIVSFDQSIKNDPTNVANYLVLGEVYLKLQNFSGAIDTLTAASKIDPRNGMVYYLLAMSKKMRGQEKDEMQAVEDAKKSVLSYQMAKDEEGFKRAVVLLKSLQDAATNPSATQ